MIVMMIIKLPNHTRDPRVQHLDENLNFIIPLYYIGLVKGSHFHFTAICWTLKPNFYTSPCYSGDECLLSSILMSTALSRLIHEPVLA